MEALGATVLNPAEVDVVDAIMQRTDCRGADAACDTAGVSTTVMAGVNFELVGAENPVTSSDLHVFVDDAAEPVSS